MPLPHVPADVQRMSDVFANLLSYERVAVPADSSADELRAALNGWLVQATLGPEDRVVFYYSGHGHVDGGSHYLCTRGFRAEAVAEGMRASDLVALVLARDARPGKMLFILDCCYASRAAGRTLLNHALERTDCYLLAASAEGPAYDGVFSQAFEDVIGSAGPPSSLDELAAALKGRVGNRQSIRHLGVGGDRFDFLDQEATRAGPADAGPKAAPAAPARIPSALLAAPSGAPSLAGWATQATLRRRLIGISAFIALVGALGIWGLSERGEKRPKAPLPPAVSPLPTQTTGWAADKIVIPGITMRFGIGADAARALYDECRRSPGENCGTDFESSVFARSAVGSSQQTVRSFSIDTHEVSNLSFARFLDTLAGSLRRNSWASVGVLLRDANGRALAAAAAEPKEATPYGIERVGEHIAAVAGRELRAANYLTWYAADAYCRAQGGRLPTELEWELAARGSEGGAYPWGNGVPDCRGVTFAGDGSDCPPHRTAPVNVGSSPLDRSPLGVWDLGGNVLEWTASRLESTLSVDRERCANEGCAVVRGGSYLDHSIWLHSVLRSRFNVANVVDNLGFRCVQDLP